MEEKRKKKQKGIEDWKHDRRDYESKEENKKVEKIENMIGRDYGSKEKNEKVEKIKTIQDMQDSR